MIGVSTDRSDSWPPRRYPFVATCRVIENTRKAPTETTAWGDATAELGGPAPGDYARARVQFDCSVDEGTVKKRAARGHQWAATDRIGGSKPAAHAGVGRPARYRSAPTSGGGSQRGTVEGFEEGDGYIDPDPKEGTTRETRGAGEDLWSAADSGAPNANPCGTRRSHATNSGSARGRTESAGRSGGNRLLRRRRAAISCREPESSPDRRAVRSFRFRPRRRRGRRRRRIEGSNPREPTTRP